MVADKSRLVGVCVTLLLLASCGPGTGQHSKGARAKKPLARSARGSPHLPITSYKWPALSTYPVFAGSVARSDACTASDEIKAATDSVPRIFQCWAGQIAGHSFVYAALYTSDKQGYQITVDGITQVQDTNGVPDVYQFSGDYACTGSGAAAWMIAINLTTGTSYNAAYGKPQSRVVNRHCASPANPAVTTAKYVIGIPGDIPMQ